MQCTIFATLPTWAVFPLSLSLPLQVLPIIINIISTDGKQDVLMQPEANPDLLYLVSGLSFKKLCWNKFPYVCYRILTLGLSCWHVLITLMLFITSLQEIVSLNHVCLLNHTNHKLWCEANILFPSKSSLPFSLFLFVRRLESTRTNS